MTISPFYCYKDKDQKEIDLLIVQDGTIYPVEIKKTASLGKNMVRHFKTLERLNMPVGSGAIICLVLQTIPLTAEITALPVGVI